MNEALVQTIAVDVSGKHTVELRDIRRDVVGMGQLRPGLRGKFLPRISEDLAEAIVHLDPALFEGGDRHADQAQFEVLAIPLFARPESLFGALAVGDVFVGADHAQGGAVCIPRDDFAPVQNPFVRAVLAAHPVLIEVELGLASEVPLDIGHCERKIVGMDARGPFLQAVADLLRGIAEHVLPAVGEKDLVGDGIPVPDAVTAAFECIGPAFFGLPQSLLGIPLALDIDAAADVPGEDAGHIVLRGAPVEQPMVDPVMASPPILYFERLATVERGAIGLTASLNVVRMHALRPAVAIFLCHRASREGQPRVIEPGAGLGGVCHPD